MNRGAESMQFADDTRDYAPNLYSMLATIVGSMVHILRDGSKFLPWDLNSEED